MELRFLKKIIRKRSVILPFAFAIVLGDVCAGMELKTGGDAPVTSPLVRQDAFQPQIKESTQQNQNILKAEYLFIQGRILETEKKERQALQCYERACQYVSSDAILVSLVSLAIRQKRYDEALRYFDKISDPSLLGIEVLNEMSTRCARLEDPRITKTYRAILRAIPVNKTGPLRMLIHDRLGWAEYRAGNFDEALTSLKIIHDMLKNPARYGISKEELALFDDSGEINLFLLMDIFITQKKGDEAEEILNELELFFNERFKSVASESPEQKIKQKNAQSHILFEKARVAYVKENAEKAFQLATEAYGNGFVDENPPFQLLEKILEAQNRSNELSNVLERLLEKQPNNLRLKIRLGEEYLKRATDDALDDSLRKSAEKKALGIFSQLAEKTPNSPFYRFRQMELAILMNDANEFLKLVDSFMMNTEIDASSKDILKNLGLASTQNSERLDALKNTQKEENPSSDSLVASAEKPTESEQEKLEPDLENAQPSKFIPSDILQQFMAELLQKAARQLNAPHSGQTEQTLPLNWRLAAFLTILADQMNRTDLATTFYSAASDELKQVQLTSDNQIAVRRAMLSLAYFLFANEKYDEAEEFFRLLERFFPEEPFFAAHIQVLMTLGKLEDAEQKIKRLKLEYPESIEFPLLEANCLLQNQKLQDARNLLKELLTEVENDYSAEFNREQVAEIRLSLANVEEQLGDVEAAEEQLRLILDEFPDDVATKNTLAYFWSCANIKLSLALRYSKETLEEEPGNPVFLDTLGWILFQLGDFEKAEAFLLEAEKDLKDPVVFSHLGDVFLASGQIEKAKQYFQKALELFLESQRKQKSIILKDLKHVETQLKFLKNS